MAQKPEPSAKDLVCGVVSDIANRAGNGRNEQRSKEDNTDNKKNLNDVVLALLHAFLRTNQSLDDIEADTNQRQRRGNRLQHIPEALQNTLTGRRDLLEALRGVRIRRKSGDGKHSSRQAHDRC